MTGKIQLKQEKKQLSTYEELSEIWDMAWKVSVATLCRLSLSTIDTAFLGHLGTAQLSAAAVANVFMFVPQVFMYGCAVSLNTLCGQAYGAQNYELVGIWLQISIIFLTIMSIPVIVFFFYIENLVALFIEDPEVVHLAGTFARYSALTVWPTCIYCAVRQYFQAQSVVYPATVTSVMSVGVNIIGNFILIYGIGSWKGLGFIGSPLATFFAAIFQNTAFWLYTCWWHELHKKTWKGWSLECLSAIRISRFCRLAFSLTLKIALDEWVYSCISFMASLIGPIYVASMGILNGLWGLLFAFYWGFGCPTQIRTANYLGANEPENAKRVARLGLVLGFMSAVVAGLFMIFFRYQVAHLFSRDDAIVELIVHTMPYFVLAVLASSIMLILSATLEAMSRATLLAVVTACGSWLFTLPASYLFGVYLDWRLEGMWFASFCGEFTKMLIYTFYVLTTDWEEMARQAMEQSEATGPLLQSEDDVNEDSMLERVMALQATPGRMFSPDFITSPKLGARIATPEIRKRRNSKVRTQSYGSVNA